jgi:hypothetical protein
MEGFGGPAQPSPTIGQALNGGYPQTVKSYLRRLPMTSLNQRFRVATES